MRVDGDCTSRLRKRNEGDFRGFCLIQEDQQYSQSDSKKMICSKKREAQEEKVGITNWVITAKSKAEAVCLIQIKWVCI